jgi:uracil-DNA glycosylase
MSFHKSWLPLFNKYDFNLDEFYKSNKDEGTDIYPPKELVFRAFSIPVKDIQVCLLGQDVYHQPNQAMGLAFSVPQNIKIPPSLANIFKELKNEFPERGYNFTHGDLTKWATNENIFLLNCALTVKKSKPLSHMKKWEAFTDEVIRYIANHNNKCVFFLLGNYAKEKSKIIGNENENDNDTRCVKGIHPSPLSANTVQKRSDGSIGGFLNSGIFKKVEELVGKPIEWQN